MQKQAPSAGRVATMVLFALSCFGLLLYLWSSFGGSVPLGAQGYRFDIRFPEATQLSDNADVRIAGVNVGRIVGLEPDGERTRATVEMDSEYAPVPRDARAILRVKTLLGETYVELTPGRREAGPLPDGGTLADGQVAGTTELDEVLRTFDPRTRAALRRVVRGLARSFEGRAGSVNASLGSLAPLTSDAGSVLGTLDRQRAALGRLTHDTGAVFEALGRRDGELRALTGSLAALLDTTARRDAELEASVRALPATLRELRATLVELRALAVEADPVVTALRPAGRSLGPAVRELSLLAPELTPLFGDVERLAGAAREGLPAATRVVERLHPAVREIVEPALAEALPVVEYLVRYDVDVAGTFAGGASATDAAAPQVPGGPPLRYLRALVPLSAEALAAADERLGSNRANAYRAPGALAQIGAPGGPESFDCRHESNPSPHTAPPCREQQPIEFQGRRLRYPHVERDR